MPEDSAFYKGILDNLYEGVYFVDRERIITYWNKGAERITGYASERVIGRSCRDDLLNHVTAEGVQLCHGHCPLAACMEDGKAREADAFVLHADGHREPVLVHATPLRDAHGNIVGAVQTFSSGTGLMAVRQELRDLRRTVQMDKLTGIHNRRYLEGRLRGVIAQLEDQADAKAGLLFVDIDHFKSFNDTHGHDVGDKVLRMVAANLQRNLRKSDTIGRWGGEEFLAILYDVASLDALKSLSEKLRVLVECSRLDSAGTGQAVTISIGATLSLPGDTAESIVRRADELMYKSKQGGRNRVSVG